MTEYVLDASALCALLFRETGHEKVAAYIGSSCMSAVNLAEVLTKSLDYGKALAPSRSFIANLPIRIIAYD